VFEIDDKVDDLNGRVMRVLLTHMIEKQSVIRQALDLIMISKNLERIGDLATNIAEDVVLSIRPGLSSIIVKKGLNLLNILELYVGGRDSGEPHLYRPV
jgi:phosphate uptake regulator